MRVVILFLFLLWNTILNAQDVFREEIMLGGKSFTIYDQNRVHKLMDSTVYVVIGNNGDKLEQIAHILDLSTGKDVKRGIYRKNDTELHFVIYDMLAEGMPQDHFVYKPDKNGNLRLVKQDLGLKESPKDLPPKFKDNKPIHPLYPGGDEALLEWADKHIAPILKSKTKGNSMNIQLEIDSEGKASLINVTFLGLDMNTEKTLFDVINSMPKWNTIVQGYKVSGFVILPVVLR